MVQMVLKWYLWARQGANEWQRNVEPIQCKQIVKNILFCYNSVRENSLQSICPSYSLSLSFSLKEPKYKYHCFSLSLLCLSMPPTTSHEIYLVSYWKPLVQWTWQTFKLWSQKSTEVLHNPLFRGLDYCLLVATGFISVTKNCQLITAWYITRGATIRHRSLIFYLFSS